VEHFTLLPDLHVAFRPEKELPSLSDPSGNVRGAYCRTKRSLFQGSSRRSGPPSGGVSGQAAMVGLGDRAGLRRKQKPSNV